MTDVSESTEVKTEAQTPVAENESLTLEQRLAIATERKPEPEKLKVDTSFFGSDDDEAIETNKATEAKPANVDNKDTQENKPTAPITEKAKRSSASVAVGMLDMTFQTILTPIHGWKFKRKFKADEVKKLDDYVADSTLDDLDESDKKLKRKWDRLLKNYEKKKDAIPLADKEKQDLENAFYQYFSFKEKTLPPEWFVGMAVINSLGKRAIDLIVD